MGSVLGDKVGRALGEGELGRVVGAIVGLFDGSAVMVAVGDRVGRIVGAAEGLCVFVGPLVLGVLVGRGDIDGAEEGLLLGCEEGALDGGSEGPALGATVGR